MDGFGAFLSDGMSYYARLNRRLQEVFGSVDGQGGTAPRGPSPHVASSRCLLYLGDLSRYAALHTPGEAALKDWSQPAGYYAASARVFPGGGIAHNQLAVVATYSRDDARAAYRYARAMLTSAPFPTARANLGLMLDKSRAAGSPAVGCDAAWVRAQLAVFTRHASCVDAARAALAALEQELEGEEGRASLLAWAPPESAPRALHLAAIALAGAVTGGWCAPPGGSASTTPLAGGREGAAAAQAAAQAAAWLLLYGLLARLLLLAERQVGRPAARWSALAVALPLLEWAAGCAEDALPTPGATHPAEALERDGAWTAAAALFNALQGAGASCAGAAAAPPVPRGAPSSPALSVALAEDYELRGFTPLAPAHAALRFVGQLGFAAATGAALQGEPDSVWRSRAQRALAAGQRIAAAGGGTWQSPLTRSPATGQFAARHQHPLSAPQQPPAALHESFGALIERASELQGVPSAPAGDEEVAGERIVWRPQPPLAGPPKRSSIALFPASPAAPGRAFPPPPPPPPPPPAAYSAHEIAPGAAAMDEDLSWGAALAPRAQPVGAPAEASAAQPLPFRGLLAAASRALPTLPPPGFAQPLLRTSNPFIV